MSLPKRKYPDASGYGGGIVTVVLDMGESNQIDIKPNRYKWLVER
jgi:hypothetical protein